VWWRTAVAALLPWTWFAFRNLANVFDVAATLLPVLVILAVIVLGLIAALRRQPSFLLVAGSCAVMGSVAVVGPWLPHRGPAPLTPVRVVFANLNETNPTVDTALRQVAAQDGDLVEVTETARYYDRVKAMLSRSYPYQTDTPNGDPLLFSRYPVRWVDIPAGSYADRVELDSPAGRLSILTSHPARPHLAAPGVMVADYRDHRSAISGLTETARREPGPAMVLGDLNLSDRTTAYRRLAGTFRDAMRTSWTGPTYTKFTYRPLFFRIDHVFILRSWCAAGAHHFNVTGSDHAGISVSIGPCPRRTGPP
jgi:endonuclease/exonuclease/phosphatase (EEP) superfamily protein YafD